MASWLPTNISIQVANSIIHDFASQVEHLLHLIHRKKEGDIDTLLTAGWSDKTVEDVINVVSVFNFLNRLKRVAFDVIQTHAHRHPRERGDPPLDLGK